MGIKSLDELKRIREKSMGKINLRQQSNDGDTIEILVGMATCGIASGARETLNTINSEISNKNLSNVKVVPVGCIGYCHSEPIIQVNMPDKKPVLYGKVDGARATEIIKSHIIDGKPIEKYTLDMDFERAKQF